MHKAIIDFFHHKKVLILGFGREGRSTYQMLRRFLPDQDLTIADSRDLTNTELAKDAHVNFHCGENYLDLLADFDIIMKSPGISFVGLDISEFKDKITSQLELALQFLPLFTIGITGTKGKSTTSSLIYQILQDQGIDSLLLGNIGTPIFDHLDDLRPGMTLVLEMSSHQLEFVHHSPNLAILLNLYEEHLDHYDSFQAYAAAKCNIFRFQTSEDLFLYNADDETLQKLISHPPAQTFPISLSGATSSATSYHDQEIYFRHQPLYDTTSPRQLLGEYNLRNIIFALSAAKLLNLDLQKATSTVNNFHTLGHRLEFVGEFNHIKYYDNSIGTVPMATIEAIKALGDVDTLIVGGMDRGVDQDSLIDFLRTSTVEHVICMPETGNQIAAALPESQAIRVKTLEEAVAIAKSVTAPHRSCLLSPAAASYGMFKNFEEKGDRFQALVRAA